MLLVQTQASTSPSPVLALQTRLLVKMTCWNDHLCTPKKCSSVASQPSIHFLNHLSNLGSWGCWNLNQLSQGERLCTSWTANLYVQWQLCQLDWS